MSSTSNVTTNPPDNDPVLDHSQVSATLLEKLQAKAFQSLCQHLQEQSDTVANIDMMNLTGFCRNCLAKWMVLGARQLVDDSQSSLSLPQINALNQLGYDEAAQHVYGMHYKDWKQRHQHKATPEQLDAFNNQTNHHAKHDKELLAKRETKAVVISNVCCQDVDGPTNNTNKGPMQKPNPNVLRVAEPQLPPPLPSSMALSKLKISVGILTVSDRAFQGTYATGDLSGPAVAEAIQSVLAKNNNTFQIDASFEIVPDEISKIVQQVTSWCQDDDMAMDIILTTGGSGFGPRDVTPEAMHQLPNFVECPTLMPFVLNECSKIQPLASLSRGTVGIVTNKSNHSCLVANLPGNPKGVGEVIPILVPLLVHALVDLRQGDGS